MLKTDVAVHILLLIDNLQDLRNMIITAGVFLDAYRQRRNLITGTVLCNEIRFEYNATPRGPLVHGDAVVKRLRSNTSNHAIMIYESIRPLMIPFRRSCSEWILKLACLPSPCRRLALFEDTHATLIAMTPNFSQGSAVPREKTCSRLRTAEQNICRELTHEPVVRDRLQDALQVRKNTHQRLDLQRMNGLERGTAVMDTYHAIEDDKGTILYARSLYDISRARSTSCTSGIELDWARHVVAVYSNAGQLVEASRQQEYQTDIDAQT